MVFRSQCHRTREKVDQSTGRAKTSTYTILDTSFMAGWIWIEIFIFAVLSVYTGGQIMTPSTSQCGVNYLDLGSGTTMDVSEFYQTYVNDPTVTSLSDCTHLCDVDSQCKAIGYMDDVSGVACGLSESDHVTATACPSCHVFTKNCSADCVTYTVFSGGYIGREDAIRQLRPFFLHRMLGQMYQ